MPDFTHSILGLDIPNFLPDWHFFRPAGRLIWSSLLLLVGVVVAIGVIRRPKRSAEPATWAATIVGAVFVWALMTLAYAVVPHEWLTFSGAYLRWTKSAFLVRQDQWGTNLPPFAVSKEALAHIVVSGIYVVMLGLNVYLFAAWQKRTVREPVVVAEGEEPGPVTGGFGRFRRRGAGTSAYGRPVASTE